MSIPISDSALYQENLTHIEKVEKVKDLISKLEKAKADLLNDSNELKKEIERAVGIQLCNLHLRELQMWRQVDALIGHQNLLIQEELSKLHFLLGSYKVASAFVEEGQSIQGLNLIDMFFKSFKLGSIPKLNFKVDHEALQLAIHGFGKLEPQCNSGAPGMLLLPAEEDYEDGDHHVLYKSVTDEQDMECNSGAPGMLLLPAEEDYEDGDHHVLYKSVTDEQDMEETPPPLKLSSNGSSVLQEVKPFSPKPLSYSSGESFEILDGDETQLQQLEVTTPLLRELKDCCTCQSSSDVEIENLDELSCSSSHQTSPIDEWLRPPVSPCVSNVPPAVLLARDYATVPLVETVCKANEKCATFSNCVCNENCMVSSLKEQMGHMNFTECGKYSPIYLKETLNSIIQKNYVDCHPKFGLLQKNNSDDPLKSSCTAPYDGWLSKDYFKSSLATSASDENSTSSVTKSENAIWLSDCVPHRSSSKCNDPKIALKPWLYVEDHFKESCKPAISMRQMFFSYLQPTDVTEWLIEKK